MKNFEKIAYTYKHRKVMNYLARKFYNKKELLDRLKQHDMDKMYMLLFFDNKNVKEVHRSLIPHHDNDIPKDKLDYIEMVLDWESARYTKEDKPFNAYDTLYKFYPHLEDKILPILKEFGVDNSSFDRDEDVVEYVKSIGEVSEQDIKKELIDYIKKM